MASTLPDAKRLMDHDIFTSFHNDNRLMKELSEAMIWLNEKGQGLCLLKILNCNAYLGEPFSNAFCETSRNVQELDKRKAFCFVSIFEHGFRTLESYIESSHNLPNRNGERIALQRLLEFIKCYWKDCRNALLSSETLTETDFEVRLAHHLLSRLSVNQNYIFKEDLGRKCPCCKENISGTFGDTSIGATSVWHGYVDILLGGNTVPVYIAMDDPESPVGSETSFDNYMEKTKQQIIAETIVFSYLQKKTNPDYENFLIPTIGMTSDFVVLYLYDCENDVLIESSPLDLFLNAQTEMDLSLGTVLALWLAINYKYCCSGTPTSMINLNYKSDFPKYIKPVQKVYLEDIQHGCGFGKPKSRQKLLFQPHTYRDMPYDHGNYKGKMCKH